jgi:hypothetical protein
MGKVATLDVITRAPDTERTSDHAQIDFATALKRSAAIHSTLVVFAGLTFR